MFDRWYGDILTAMKTVSGDRELQPDDCLIANNVLFVILKSFAWKGAFDGATLSVSDDGSGYSYVTLHEYLDPYSSNLEIRRKTNINVLDFKYEYSDYDDNHIVWERDHDAKINIYDEPFASEVCERVLRVIKENKYYAMLLESSIEGQCKINSSLFDIEYSVVDEDDAFDRLIEITNMSSYSTHPIKSVFGHRYFSMDCSNRKLIVAKNKLGPVGILCLFDHSMPDVLDKDNNRLSISYVSVSPGYRNHGISKNLLRHAFDYAIKNEKYIARTDPTEIGKLISYSSFSSLAKNEYPSIPFLTCSKARLLWSLTRSDGFQNLDYKKRNSIILLAEKKIDKVLTSKGMDPYEIFDSWLHDFVELEQFIKKFNNGKTAMESECEMSPS